MFITFMGLLERQESWVDPNHCPSSYRNFPMESLKKNSVKLANHWLICQYSQPTDLPAKLPCRFCSPKASWSNGDQSTTTRCLTFVICFFVQKVEALFSGRVDTCLEVRRHHSEISTLMILLVSHIFRLHVFLQLPTLQI